MARSVLDRFIGGENLDDAIAKAQRLADDGFHVSFAPIEATRDEISELIERIKTTELTDVAEISIQMSTLGETDRIRRSEVHSIADEASPLNVTLAAEGSVEAELAVVRDNLTAFPGLGLTIAANQRRSEADCKSLANTNARVRLVKGAFTTEGNVAYSNGPELDKAFVRCLKILMAGSCRPMIATHDDRLLEIAKALAVRNGRAQGSYEFDLYLGVANKLADRLVESGEDVRMYLPFGEAWSDFLFSRQVLRPSNVGTLLKGFAGSVTA